MKSEPWFKHCRRFAVLCVLLGMSKSQSVKKSIRLSKANAIEQPAASTPVAMAARFGPSSPVSTSPLPSSSTCSTSASASNSSRSTAGFNAAFAKLQAGSGPEQCCDLSGSDTLPLARLVPSGVSPLSLFTGPAPPNPEKEAFRLGDEMPFTPAALRRVLTAQHSDGTAPRRRVLTAQHSDGSATTSHSDGSATTLEFGTPRRGPRRRVGSATTLEFGTPAPASGPAGSGPADVEGPSTALAIPPLASPPPKATLAATRAAAPRVGKAAKAPPKAAKARGARAKAPPKARGAHRAKAKAVYRGVASKAKAAARHHAYAKAGAPKARGRCPPGAPRSEHGLRIRRALLRRPAATVPSGPTIALHDRIPADCSGLQMERAAEQAVMGTCRTVIFHGNGHTADAFIRIPDEFRALETEIGQGGQYVRVKLSKERQA